MRERFGKKPVLASTLMCATSVYILTLLGSDLLLAQAPTVKSEEEASAANSKNLKPVDIIVYSGSSGPRRTLTLSFYEEESEKPVDLNVLLDSMAKGEWAFGSHVLVLLEGSVGPLPDERIVWYGMASVWDAAHVENVFDARVVWARPSDRLFVVLAESIAGSEVFTIYEVEFDSGSATFALQMPLGAELRLSKAPKALTKQSMVSDLCLRNRLQVIPERDALVMMVDRKDGSCEEKWFRLDLKSLTWSRLELKEVSSEETAEGDSD